MTISVVIPVYGCSEAVQPLSDRLHHTLKKITKDYEIILVDDHCPQNSWKEIEIACKKDTRVKGIQLSRNFGQIRAIMAGLEFSSGDWVVVMDCDLQDRPEAIEELYLKAKEGYDIVFVKRKSRKSCKIMSLLTAYFYKIYNYFTEGNYDGSLSNFSIVSRKVVKQYLLMREQTRAYTLFLKWLGFEQAVIELDEDTRFSGKSSYSFHKKMWLALDIMTTQSNKPLLLSIKIGFFLSFFSFLYLFILVIQYLTQTSILAGWTSIIASIYLVGGLMLIMLGILGIYIGNIFNETKHRPIYVVSTVRNITMSEGEDQW